MNPTFADSSFYLFTSLSLYPFVPFLRWQWVRQQLICRDGEPGCGRRIKCWQNVDKPLMLVTVETLLVAFANSVNSVKV
jgi:hypothetical protein